MPLIRKKANAPMSHAIEADGEPPSLAIALDVQRKTRPKKMAQGGTVNGAEGSKQIMKVDPNYTKELESRTPDRNGRTRNQWVQDSSDAAMTPYSTEYKAKQEADMKGYADGGEVEDRSASIADAIMRRRKMMAEGGEVDIDSNGQEDPANPNGYDDQNMEAGMKELYDDQLMDQPMDSNQHGDILSDEDANDLVSKIRRQAKLRGR